MPVYTESLPATKSTPNASIRWEPLDGGREPLRGLLVIQSPKKFARYSLVEFPADGGRGFHFVKLAGGTDPEADSYSVFIADPRPADAGYAHDGCECKGFLHTGHCKHVAAVRAILENANLWQREAEANAVELPAAEEPAPVAEPAIEDAPLDFAMLDTPAEPDPLVEFLAERERLIATARNPGWIVLGTWFTVRPDVGAVVETWANRRCVGARLAMEQDDEDRMNGRLGSYTRPRD